MKKDITNKNSKHNWHGYQEWYWDEKLLLRGKYINGQPLGYFTLCEVKKPKTVYFI